MLIEHHYLADHVSQVYTHLIYNTHINILYHLRELFQIVSAVYALIHDDAFHNAVYTIDYNSKMKIFIFLEHSYVDFKYFLESSKHV